MKKRYWRRPNETKNYFIFREEPRIENIKQSKKINDCFYLSALGALCTKKINIIKDLFHVTDKTKEHVYGIYFHIDGKRTLVLVDDYLAYDTIDNLYFSSSYVTEELWVSLIEKAFAKVKGGYMNLDRGFAKDAFEYLTGAYTEKITIGNKPKEILWKELNNPKNYPMCAGTKSVFNFFSFNNLKEKHEYTITDVYVEEVVKKGVKNKLRKVELRDPYGKNQKYNLGERKDEFSISFDDFYKNFYLLEINYFQKDFKENFVKIKKKQSFRMQIFELKNEIEENEVSINLYQKNKYVPVFCYIMLIRKNEENNTYEYLNSKTSLKSENNYERHIALKNINLEKGIYYICCDINYRFLDKSKKNENIHGYNLNLFSKKEIKNENFKNVTEQITINERTKLIKNALFPLFKENEENEYITPYIDKNNIMNNNMRVFLFNNKDKFPFDIFYFGNLKDDPLKIKFNIIENNSNRNYCFYNDIIAGEFDNSLIKEIKKGQYEIITIMNFKYKKRRMDSIKKALKYEIFVENDALGQNHEHYVFKEYEVKRNIIDKPKEKVEIYKKKYGNNGLILGFKCVTENDLNYFNLKISLDNWIISDQQELNYDQKDFKFKLKNGEKKVFNLRKRIGEEKEDCSIDIQK